MATLSSGAAARVAALRVGNVVFDGQGPVSLALGLRQSDDAGAVRNVTVKAREAGTLSAVPGHYVRVGPAGCGASAVPPWVACAATARRLIADATVRVGFFLLSAPLPPPPLVDAGGTGGAPPGRDGASPTARPTGATAGSAEAAAV